MRRLSILCLALFAVPAIAQTTATLPTTCRPDGTQCVTATPVTNPDGSLIGGGGGGGSVPTGSAGSPNAAVVSVQGVSGGTPVPISAISLPLPTGAATAANQVTEIANQMATGTSAQTVQGNVASGVADSGNPLKVGCKYNNPLTGMTNGARIDCQADQYGSIRVTPTLVTNQTADGVSSTLIGTTYQYGSQNASVIQAIAGYSFNGTTLDRFRTLQATDAGAGLGVSAVGIAPTSAAGQSLTSSTVAAATSDTLKSAAGNVYSLNLVNSTTAGFVVLYDAATAPTSGTALTTGLIRYCFPVVASAGFDKVFAVPMQMASGAVELFSTSCTTYTAVSPAPIIMTGQVK